MDYFKFLPVEITLDILTRVPAESVLCCKSVCKTWNFVSRHQSFAKLHFHHLDNPSDCAADSGKLSFIAKIGYNPEKFYYTEYNENHRSAPSLKITRIDFMPPFTKFIGSYNGLICFSQPRAGNPARTHVPVCICNPITKEYAVLPEIKTDCDYLEDFTTGFGYVSSTNEYKVVRVGTLMDESVEVHIYTVGSGSGWRNLGKFNPQFRPYSREGAGIFANGAIYWMSFHSGMILTFDLAEEKFCEHLSPPALVKGYNWFSNKIGVLDGCLFYAMISLQSGWYDIWLFKKENDIPVMKEGEDNHALGWSKVFWVGESKLLASTKSNGFLTYLDNNVNIHKTRTIASKRLVKFKETLRKIFPHRNTLVSIKELGEEDTKRMESGEV